MDLFFDAPWWFYAIPFAVGAAMAVVALRKGDKGLRNVGLLVLLAGVGIFAASKLVETDSEKVTRQSYELVHHVEKQQWDRLSAMLDPAAVVTLINVGPLYESREQIIEACRSRVTGSGVTALAVTRAEPQVQGDLITTEIDVYVTADDAGGRPLPTTWRLVWTKRSGEWVVRDIEAIKFPMPDVRSWFPKAR